MTNPSDSGRFSIVPDVLFGVVSRNALAVYAALARYTNAAGECWPSISRLAEDVSASKPTVFKALDELESIGAVTRLARVGDDGSMTSNFYRLHAWNIEGVVKNLNGGSKESLRGVVKILNGGSKESLHELDPMNHIQLELDSVKNTDAAASKEVSRRDGSFPAFSRLPRRGNQRVYPEEFTKFWETYPRRKNDTDKKGAYAKWRTAVQEEASVEEIQAGAERYAADPNRSPKYTYNAHRWLEKSAWEAGPVEADELAITRSQRAAASDMARYAAQRAAQQDYRQIGATR